MAAPLIRWILALHVVAIISWMAGLLYIYRLYVYHAAETEAVVKSRFEIMERRLLNAITTPAALVALITGVTMLSLQPGLLSQPWMWVKLACVLGLFAMHGLAVRYRRVLLTETRPHKMFRVMNEIPTLLMIVIVICVIVRP